MRYLVPLCVLLPLAAFPTQPADVPKHTLLIAFASFRDRPKQPTIYFYEHDGVGDGKIVGSIDTTNLRSDSHPSSLQKQCRNSCSC